MKSFCLFRKDAQTANKWSRKIVAQPVKMECVGKGTEVLFNVLNKWTHLTTLFVFSLIICLSWILIYSIIFILTRFELTFVASFVNSLACIYSRVSRYLLMTLWVLCWSYDGADTTAECWISEISGRAHLGACWAAEATCWAEWAAGAGAEVTASASATFTIHY